MYFQNLNSSTPLLAGDCFHNGQTKDFSTLKNDCILPHIPLWSYFQIHIYTNSKVHKKEFIRPLTELELVCISGEHFERAASVSYTWLQNSNSNQEDGFRRSWSKALQMNITEVQWRNACILSHKCSLSTKNAGNGLQIADKLVPYLGKAEYVEPADPQHLLEVPE